MTMMVEITSGDHVLVRANKSYAGELSWNDVERDVVLICENDFRCGFHKALLCSASSLFRSLLELHDMCHSEREFVISLPDLKCSQVLRLKELLYEGTVRCTNEKKLRDLESTLVWLGIHCFSVEAVDKSNSSEEVSSSVVRSPAAALGVQTCDKTSLGRGSDEGKMASCNATNKECIEVLSRIKASAGAKRKLKNIGEGANTGAEEKSEKRQRKRSGSCQGDDTGRGASIADVGRTLEEGETCGDNATRAMMSSSSDGESLSAENVLKTAVPATTKSATVPERQLTREEEEIMIIEDLSFDSDGLEDGTPFSAKVKSENCTDSDPKSKDAITIKKEKDVLNTDGGLAELTAAQTEVDDNCNNDTVKVKEEDVKTEAKDKWLSSPTPIGLKKEAADKTKPALMKSNTNRRLSRKSPLSQPVSPREIYKKLFCPDTACMFTTFAPHYMFCHVEKDHPKMASRTCSHCWVTFPSKFALSQHSTVGMKICPCGKRFCNDKEQRRHASQGRCAESGNRQSFSQV